MKKMTKRESLENCIRIWEWLAENPNSEKDDAFSALEIEEPMLHLCPACEYTNQVEEDEYDAAYCQHCPVWTFRGVRYMCENTDEGGEFYMWRRYAGDSKARIRWASKIATMAKRKLEVLDV